MNWMVFAIFAYIALALQTGLGTLLGIPDATGARPGFVLILGVFVASMAPARSAVVAMLILGILIDLQPGDLNYPLIGPVAMGYMIGGFATLQLRTMVLRQTVLTLVVMIVLVGMLVALVSVAMLVMRGWTTEAIEHWSAADALFKHFLSLLYTTVLAIPISYILLRSTALWGFTSKSRVGRY